MHFAGINSFLDEWVLNVNLVGDNALARLDTLVVLSNVSFTTFPAISHSTSTEYSSGLQTPGMLYPFQFTRVLPLRTPSRILYFILVRTSNVE